MGSKTIERREGEIRDHGEERGWDQGRGRGIRDIEKRGWDQGPWRGEGMGSGTMERRGDGIRDHGEERG